MTERAFVTGRTVVLVQPPFLRLAGSHNDRAPLELCYLARYLQNAGHDAIVLNADATDASAYIPWSRLFDNFRWVMAAADGDSAVYDETVERLCALSPDVVVIAAADNVTPWVDSGNAYVSAELSRRLRAFGRFTVGTGPFYTAVPDRFAASFDALLTGGPSPSIADIVTDLRTGVHAGRPHDVTVLPCTDVRSGSRNDVVMTAFGCPHSCTFCFAREQPYRPVPVDRVAVDVAARTADLIDFGDAILPLGRQRLRDLAAAVRGMGKAYTCEVSVKSVTPANLESLSELGVTQVKLGVESGDEDQLAAMQKRQNRKQILDAAHAIRAHGLRFSAYVLLGGPNSSPTTVEDTYDLCRELDADDYVINVWAHHELATRDFRYDGHFSSHLVGQWGLTEQMPRFFDLQDQRRKFGLGTLLRPRVGGIDHAAACA